jgi:hypothetical protein
MIVLGAFFILVSYLGWVLDIIFNFEKSAYFDDSPIGIILYVITGVSILTIAILVKFIRLSSFIIYPVFFILLISLVFYLVNVE